MAEGGKMAGSVRVVPAILTEDPKTLEKMLRQAATFTDYVQIDIMDGKFVPSRSVSAEQIGAIKSKIKWEVHLMVVKPERQLEKFMEAGARRAIFHYEATDVPEQVITMAQKVGLEVGMAVNPETSITKILPLTGLLDCVLFLSVNPGFYGARFIPEVPNKIRDLRQARPRLEIGIDGGIKDSNIAQIAKTGVNYICVGSAVFQQPQPGEAYRKLLALANS
jgi:ribulose-phosphate 3-epimerase